MSDNRLNNRASVIIRSIGERTEYLCKEMILTQGILDENILVIKRKPFTLALQASYETGIALDRPWTLCLDADVLILPKTISDIINFADQQDLSIFEIQGLILDKFFGGNRDGGLHLYRTSYLSQALKYIPHEQNIIRPEFYVLESMRNQGHPWKRMIYLTGIHDFEQYYADIFRKCFVQAHKHQEYAEIFITYWPEQGIRDFDYKIALKGFLAGIEFDGNVHIDAQHDLYKECFEKLQIDEKQDLPPGYFSPSDVENLVTNWKEPLVYQKYFPNMTVSQGEKRIRENAGKKLFAKLRTLGPFRMLLYTIGWGLERVGDKIKRMVGAGENLQ
jgi:hypothetical protein